MSKIKLIIVLISLMVRAFVSDAATLVGDLYYDLNENNNTAVVVRADYSSLKNVIIPSAITVNGIEYSVTEIGRYAFRENGSIESVVIPGSVITIGAASFIECTALTSVSLEEGIQNIAADAFNKCTELIEIKIPDSVTQLDSYSFYGCSNLKAITFGEKTTKFGDNAFAYCEVLEEITFKSTANAIHPQNVGVFIGCNNIKKINISGINEWMSSDFGYQGSPLYAENAKLYIDGEKVEITDLVIPAEVTKVGDAAFYNMGSIETIVVPGHVEEIGAEAFVGNPVKSLTLNDCERQIKIYSEYEDRSGITHINSLLKATACESVYLGRNVDAQKIQSSNTSVKNVVLGEFCDNIYDGMFYDCSNLEEIKLNSIKYIGSNAFYNCTSLQQIHLYQESPCTIAENSFTDATLSSAQLIVPDGSKNTYASADQWKRFTRIVECNTIWINKDIHLEQAGSLLNRLSMDELERIRELKLSGEMNGTDLLVLNKMINLRKLDLTDVRLKKGGMAYYEHDGVNYIMNDDELNSFWAYGLSYLKELSFPSTLKYLGDKACSNLGFIEKLVLPPSLVEAGYEPFGSLGMSMSMLKELIIEDGDELLTIDTGTPLPVEHAYIGRSVALKYRNIFDIRLKHLEISPKVRMLDNLIASPSYNNSPVSILRLDISDLDAYCRIDFRDGRLIPDRAKLTVYLNDEKLENLVIPQDIKTLNSGPFSHWSNLKSVIIPPSANVGIINSNTFYGCSNLEWVSISGTVKQIKNYAFSGTGLKSIRLPYSISEIDSDVFSDCEHLTEVYLPSSITKIAYDAFSNCNSIKTVWAPNVTPPAIEQSSFSQTAYENANLWVNNDAQMLYWLHPVWGKFKNINTAAGIDNDAWKVNLSIKSDYSESVGAIIVKGGDATGDIVIPSHVEHEGEVFPIVTIAPEAFKGNTKITSVTLPNTIEYIGYDAFSGCTNLTSVTFGSAEVRNMRMKKAPNGNILEQEPSIIGDRAFAGCENITSVISYMALPPRAEQNVFSDNIYRSARLTVPSQNLDDYINSEYAWHLFNNSVSGIENISIEDSASPEIIVEDGRVIICSDEATEYELFNLLGMKVAEGVGNTIEGIEKGIYIIRFNNKNIKIYIR